ncbi:type VII secretion target [Actinomadura adrarensis]|uniref:Type VII secretion target n=1 Tax=Actinomadura adrarensis TaxID=1819600 RepID=A0ABW3CS50_9ACTN
MTFSVHPEALDAFGDSVNTLAGDAKKAYAYIDGALHGLDASKGVFFGKLYRVAVVRIGEAVKADLQKLEKLSSSSGAELKKCAQVYRGTEQKNAERVDAAYPKK